jgi:hypothetical protein
MHIGVNNDIVLVFVYFMMAILKQWCRISPILSA